MNFASCRDRASVRYWTGKGNPRTSETRFGNLDSCLLEKQGKGIRADLQWAQQKVSGWETVQGQFSPQPRVISL